jgi:hypothetical protein
MAELTAAYSPPIPNPVTNRKKPKLQKSQASALSNTPEIDDECDIKYKATPKTVRNPTKSKRARDRSHHVKRGDRSEVRARQVECVRVLQGRPQRAYDSYFKAIEYPSDPQSEHD